MENKGKKVNDQIDEDNMNLTIQSMKKKNLLIGCSGSVATVRIDQIMKAFRKNFNLKVVFTKNAKIFSDKIIKNYDEYQKEHDVKFYFDEDEYKVYEEEERVLHIDLRKWADVILIAPLSANTLAKITNGLCDNLLTCVMRAWDFSKPGFFALAMNTFMYEHFLTYKQIKILTDEFKFTQIPSAVKILKCGDYGIGGIADTSLIYQMVNDKMFPENEILNE